MINAQQIVEKMKNQKINYDTVLKKMIMQWEKEEVKPKILIHTYMLCSLQYAHVGIHVSICRYHVIFFKFEYPS